MIIEKQISKPLDKLSFFLEWVYQNKLFVNVHYHWGHSDLIKKINQIQDNHNVSKPVGIRIYGGTVRLNY